MVKVFGHLAPDTDATVAAMVFAWFLNNHRKVEATAYRLGELSREAQFVLDHFKQSAPELLGELVEGDKVAVVDTSNPEELPADISKATLTEIVDHHKLTAGLSSSEPINVTIRTFGCTETVIWSLMQEEGLKEVPKEIAGMMVAGILSDTLNFTSPTTTEADKAAVAALAQMAGENPDELATAMFDAKSDLTGMSAKDLILADSKVFELSGKKVRISSLETTKPENALALRSELVEAMNTHKAENSLDGAFLFVVDILKSEATLIVPGDYEKQVATKGFGTEFTGENLVLPGVVSRKKQMVPAIEKGLA